MARKLDRMRRSTQHAILQVCTCALLYRRSRCIGRLAVVGRPTNTIVEGLRSITPYSSQCVCVWVLFTCAGIIGCGGLSTKRPKCRWQAWPDAGDPMTLPSRTSRFSHRCSLSSLSAVWLKPVSSRSRLGQSEAGSASIIQVVFIGEASIG